MIEELDACIEEQEVKIKPEVETVLEEEITEEVSANLDGLQIVEEPDDDDAEEKEYRIDGPDFRKKEVKEEENKAVMEYQKSGDLKVLETLYINRVPTLNYWARKNKHLDNNSFNDIKGELTRIFLKAVKKYKKKRTTKTSSGKKKVSQTDFNTYLYTSFNYALCNIYNRKKAKKRTPYPSENVTLTNMLLSLDYVYGTKDEEGFTLKDILSDPATGDDGKVSKKMQIDEMLDILSEGCPDFTKTFMKKISEGRSLSSLIKEYKRRTGRIKTDKKLIKKINNSRRPCVRIVSDLVKQRVSERFKLIDFHTTDCYVHYTIELHKTDETDIIMSRLRKLKKNKDFYLDKIKMD